MFEKLGRFIRTQKIIFFIKRPIFWIFLHIFKKKKKWKCSKLGFYIFEHCNFVKIFSNICTMLFHISFDVLIFEHSIPPGKTSSPIIILCNQQLQVCQLTSVQHACSHRDITCPCSEECGWDTCASMHQATCCQFVQSTTTTRRFGCGH